MKIIQYLTIITILIIAVQTNQAPNKCSSFQTKIQDDILELKELMNNKRSTFDEIFEQIFMTHMLIEQFAEQCGQFQYDLTFHPQTYECIGAQMSYGNFLNQKTNDFTQENNIGDIFKNYLYLNQVITNCAEIYFSQKLNSSGGGKNCAICTVLVQIFNNYADYYVVNITDLIENKFCAAFPQSLQVPCKLIISVLGPYIIDGYINKHPADKTCRNAKYCTNPTCNLLPQQENFLNAFLEKRILDEKMQTLDKEQSNLKITPWQLLMDLIHKFTDQHLPLVDLDGDRFSDALTFRGSSWRGTDCNDLDPQIYPGKQSYDGPRGTDYNCNGISGINPSTNKTFKEEMCDNSGQIGIIVAGDSAGAHFSLPPQWLDVTKYDGTQFHDFLFVASNELDWPHKGGYTGKLPDSKDHPLRSVYKKLVDHNRCNYNDFQNIAVNGGASGNSEGNIRAIARTTRDDIPAILFLELVGNDICNPRSLEGQTKPEEFKKNILQLMNIMDGSLPPGSHVWFFGLTDGRILWDNLHDKMHPLNVTYEQVYEFLVCLDITPCFGWLNKNETIRNISSEHAAALNNVYREIVSENITFTNFDYAYYDFPAQEIFDEYVGSGGNPVDLIEPSDGFHPNQRFNAMLADWIWVKLEKDHPDWIGEKNVYNSQIDELFKRKQTFE